MKKYIKIINIIDKSGSMSSMINTAINGFNEFLIEQKKVKGKALMTTILFSEKYKKLYEDVDVNECYELNTSNYNPVGMTALYDAVQRAINEEVDKLGNLSKDERPEKTLCVILTDGYENRSVNCNKEQIKSLISEMKKDFNWEFIFLAANEDAALTAETMGISKGNSYSFTNNSSGLQDAYRGVSYATTSYRKSKSTNIGDLMDDYEKNK